MIFASTDKNGEALENYTELWDEIKGQIETKCGNKPIEYNRDFRKIRFESDDDLPLGEILNILMCIIVLFFKKTATIIHKLVYMNVCTSVNMNMKMILIPLYE